MKLIRQQDVRQVWSLAWPVMLANITFPLLGLVDTAVMGRLDGHEYLAGVAIGASIMTFIFWGFSFLAMGVSGQVSQAFGAGQNSLIKIHLVRYLFVAGGLSALLMLVHRPLIDWSLDWMGASDLVSEQAKIYLSIRVLGIPAILFSITCLGWFVGMQNTRVALSTRMIAQVVNIVLDVVFVMALHWQVAGVAWGTVIAEYLAALLVLLAVMKHSKTLPGITWSEVFHKEAFKRIFATGQALLSRTFVLLFTLAYFNHLGAGISDSILAANAILLTFHNVISTALDGFADAGEALTGRAIGAKSRPQLIAAWRTTGVLSAGLALMLSLGFWLLGEQLIAILTNQADLQSIAKDYLPWLCLMPLWGFVAFWLDGVFVGAHLSRQMRNAVILPFFLFFLPATLWFQPLDNHLLWLLFSLYFLFRSLLMLRYWTVFYHRLAF